MFVTAKYGLRAPFWRSAEVRAEPLFFIADDGAAPAAPLLFTPESIKSLTGANGVESYEPGKDFVVRAAERKVLLTPGSRIPFLPRGELFRAPGQPLTIAHRAGYPEQMLYFSEGCHFHHMQAAVSYTHAGTWDGCVPTCQAEDLPRVSRILREGGPLSLFVIGDSITAGANASKKTGTAPFLPSYPELVAEALEEITGSPIRYWNYAVGGRCAEHGVALAEEVVAHAPDLLIIAYGMNDASRNDPALFRNHIGDILDRVEAACPRLETILVAPMRGNPEWVHTPAERFAPLRDALSSFCRRGRVLADMTALWADLLRHKTFHDLTGNGVNHPNDFGHRIYADVLLDTLLGA